MRTAERVEKRIAQRLANALRQDRRTRSRPQAFGNGRLSTSPNTTSSLLRSRTCVDKRTGTCG